jgi:hypothetical protein
VGAGHGLIEGYGVGDGKVRAGGVQGLAVQPVMAGGRGMMPADGAAG